MRVQEYEDEDEDEEPSLWTRVRSLLLSLSLQLYHRMMKVREQLQRTMRTLGDAADTVRTSKFNHNPKSFISSVKSGSEICVGCEDFRKYTLYITHYYHNFDQMTELRFIILFMYFYWKHYSVIQQTYHDIDACLSLFEYSYNSAVV